MQLHPILSFNGQCKQAFEYYERCLGGKIQFIMTYGESPTAAQTPPDQHSRIFHVTLAVADQILSGGDVAPEQYQKPQGFSIHIGIKDAAEADRIFTMLSENGIVQMPLQETFWALRFGVLVDQFGIPWIINCERSPT